MAGNPSDSTLVIIPTYNELENLPLIIERVRKATPEVEILVVDDNSPDGTGAKADEIAASDKQVHVLHRQEKTGLLGAYVAGFEWGLERDYKVICQMDADGSHAPEEFPRLLAAIDAGADLVGRADQDLDLAGELRKVHGTGGRERCDRIGDQPGEVHPERALDSGGSDGAATRAGPGNGDSARTGWSAGLTPSW